MGHSVTTAGVQSRTNRTRQHLIRAAESLFVKDGLENVSIKAIIREAGQKNESALQYHFTNREGLIREIQIRRTGQLDAIRQQLLDETLRVNSVPDIRSVCEVIIRTPFLLCRKDTTFRDYLGVFGQRLITSGEPISRFLAQLKTKNQDQLFNLLRGHLDQLDDRLFAIRHEQMSSWVVLSMYSRAREKKSFQGARAEFFFNDLVDVTEALLLAPVSVKTQQYI